MQQAVIADRPEEERLADTTPTTQVTSGDAISQFTREQVLCFPDEVKSRIVYAELSMPHGSFDCALVLGGPAQFMPSRAAAAAQLYHSGQVRLLMVSGSVDRESPFGCLSEAQILSCYLQQAGVAADRIVTENQASTTLENMHYCQCLLRQRFGDRPLRIAVVTSRFHVNRSVALAKAYLPECEVFGIGAEYPGDSAGAYLDDPLLRKCVTTECRCLWSQVQEGRIPDFPVA